MSAGEKWPRLSEDLRQDVRWGCCQRCGKHFISGADFQVIWREHDDQDRPEPRAVVLCGPCGSIIDPHPRLYAREQRDVPLPGVMELCRDCTHRRGYLCSHPDLTLNGGPGLLIEFPRPHVALVDGVRGGRRTGWRETIWTGPPTACAGRDPHPDTTEPTEEEDRPFVDQHGTRYETQKGAARALGISVGHINDVLHSRRGHVHGYRFRFVDDSHLRVREFPTPTTTPEEDDARP